MGALAAILVIAAGWPGPAQASGSVRPQHQSGNKLHGIDISHWQGPIDWSQVPRHSAKFVIAKATEGQDFTDPNYATYRAGAEARGLAWTAYHFARPDSTPNDAVLEARHFVAVAALHSGNLIPALDMEVSGGLTPAALIAWTWAWLNEVYRLLGVRAMIYTRASFWQQYMNDTQEFAAGGYGLLWIASWGSGPPVLPAKKWGGHGWTFWQWTDCGSVPGINGCVDRDKYHGLDLTPVTIP